MMLARILIGLVRAPRSPVVAAAAAALTLFAAVPLAAQIDRGQINGFVKDQTGGVIPGATVTATDTETRLAQTAVTDSTGYYVFTTLTPGLYDIDVELQGFKK